MGKTVEFFYDFSSPYAYLGHEEIGRVASAHGANVVWRPFLLGGLFKNLNVAQAPILGSSQNKKSVLMADMHRYAELRHLPFGWPEAFPLNTVRPLRVMVQLTGEVHKAVASELFRLYWGSDINIADANLLAATLNRHGLDGAALVAATETPEVKQLLIDASQEAFARGMCGAPSFFVGDQLVWGQDRFDFVGRLLDGWVPKAA